MKAAGSLVRTKKVAAVEPRRSTAQPADLPPELSIYRDHTLALLRRYVRLSVEVGRLPSLLGREFFRAQVTSYQIASFEGIVIFVHDIERCVERLDVIGRQLIARIALEEYTFDEAVALLRIPRRTLVRRYHEALDQLSDMFLRAGLLRAIVQPPPGRQVRQVKSLMACADTGDDSPLPSPLAPPPIAVKTPNAPFFPQPALPVADINLAKLALAPL